MLKFRKFVFMKHFKEISKSKNQKPEIPDYITFVSS